MLTLLFWLLVLPLLLLGAVLVGAALLAWLAAASTQLAAGVQVSASWLARHGMPMEYVVPLALALLPVTLVLLALLR
jgi:hypothetical protein